MKRKEVMKLRRAIEQAVQSLPTEIALEVPSLFEKWTVNKAVEVGERREYEGTLYEVVQAHTTQGNWTPDATPALWKEVAPEGVIPEWKQPLGAHDAYQKGDKVLYNELVYVSIVDNNVWEPTVYGWELDN